jgi:hypothetical protein
VRCRGHTTPHLPYLQHTTPQLAYSHHTTPHFPYQHHKTPPCSLSLLLSGPVPGRVRKRVKSHALVFLLLGCRKGDTGRFLSSVSIFNKMIINVLMKLAKVWVRIVNLTHFRNRSIDNKQLPTKHQIIPPTTSAGNNPYYTPHHTPHLQKTNRHHTPLETVRSGVAHLMHYV